MQIVGHRGARGEAPENTLAGIQHALSLGIVDFEIDIRLNADNIFYLMHDASLKRTCNDARYLHELDSQTLETVFANKDFDAEYFEKGLFQTEDKATSPPTLKSLFDLLTRRAKNNEISRCSFQLEIKSDEYTDSKKILDNIVNEFSPDTLAKLPCNIIFTSFDIDIVRALRRQASHLKCGVIADKNPNDAIQTAIELGCTHCCLNYRLLLEQNDKMEIKPSKNFLPVELDSLHLSVWTLNKPALVETMACLGVNSVITDIPSQFI